MPKGQKKKGKKMKENLHDPLDDLNREQVEPRWEPEDAEDQDERWAQPGDDERAPAYLPRLTDTERSN
jgi:hypothetical protein